MSSAEQRRYALNELALIVRPLTFIVLAKAPLHYCGIDSVPYLFGASALIVIASLLTMRRRLAGTRYKTWLTLVLAVAWADLLLRMTSQYVGVPKSLLISFGSAALLITPLLACIVARLATASEAREAARLFRRGAWACVIGWAISWVFIAAWSEAPGYARQASLAAFLLVAACSTVPYFLILVADAGIGRAPASGGLCANCGYSLAGLTSVTCPECGKSLVEQLANTRPLVRAPWRTIVLHTSLAACVVLAGSYGMPNNGLQRYKPLWMLMRECELGPSAFSRSSTSEGRGGFPPMWEIFRRADDGEFDQATASKLVEHCLSVQADGTAPLYQWGDLFMLFDAQGLVTDAQRRAFEEHLAIYALKLPASVSEGSHLPFTVEVVSREPYPFKASIPVRDWMVVAPRLTAVFVDGVQVPAPSRVADAISQGVTSTHDFTTAAELPRMPLGPGRHNVKMEFEIKSWANDHVKQVSTPTLTRTIALAGDITFMPGAPADVVRVTDPAAIKPLLEKWTWTYESYRLGGYKGRNGVAIQAPDDEPSLAFSVTADVVIEYKGKEYPMGRLVLKPGDRSAFIKDNMSWEPDFPVDVLPLVIRATHVEFESGLSSAWAGPEQRVNAKFRDPPPKRD